VFRGTELPYGEKVPDGVIVWFHEDGIMSQELMFNYIDMLHVIRMMNNQSNKPAIMVHDNSIDPEGPVFQKFASHNINFAVIPSGTMLSVLQPIDIINKIFKDNLIKEWDKWNAITGIIRRATITDICGWVKNAWEEISKEIIFDSFKKCRISSALNGSEDKAKFPTVDSIIKEIKADDSQSQNGGFNHEYTIEAEAEDEASSNNDEKMNEKANEEPVTEIHAIFDEYMFAETDQLAGTSAFVPLNPETVHPDHTQSSHMQSSILRSDFIQSNQLPSTHVSTNQVNRHTIGNKFFR
jgi:hypothetical protein